MNLRNHPITFILCLMALQPLSAQDKPFLEDLPYYLENLAVFEVGQEPGRAYHIPAQSISLNGKWRFQYFESVKGDGL